MSIFDIVRIIKCGPVLPGYLWRERLKTGKLVTPEAERDCKLICLVLSSEYYLFLLVGLSTVDKIFGLLHDSSELMIILFQNNPIFFLPFLVLYATIIFLESLIFFIRAFVEGIDFKKCGLIMSLFMIYNWLSVFCTFARAMTACDV